VTFTSLDYSTSSDTAHLETCLRATGETTLADKVARCCTTFRALTCTQGHVYQPIPAERCRHRLCPNCARWRQQRAVKRLWPAIKALRRQHREDRWVFITITARADHAPVRTLLRRLQQWFAKLRRTAAWKTAIRGAIADYEVTYRPDRGWHVHLHVLASRQAWWAQADLAATWHHVTGDEGGIVDIRDRDADVRSSLCRTLTYPFKPANLDAWGPAQVAEFTALKRTKLAECYGALRGLAAAAAADGDEEPPDPLPRQALTPGAPCPSCGSPLIAQWVDAEALQYARPHTPRRSLAPPVAPRAA
jgi:hypothetical protein